MSKNYLTKENIVLIANGEFPTHKKPLEIIKKNKYIICCDGAADLLIKFGQNPNIVIGDLDSIDTNINNTNIEKIINIKDQNNNDFRKALHWISENINLHKLFILGATGLREDHTLGNLTTFLYQKFKFKIEILTDAGIFYVINSSKTINSFKGQYVSIFSINPNQRITTKGLKYELNNSTIDNLYSGTLNVSNNNQISIETDLKEPLLVYFAY